MDQNRKLRPEQIAEAIRTDIEQGRHSIDKPLIQEALAKRYGVSRIPIREALKTLAAEGVLEIHPGAGTFVAMPSPAEIVEIFEIRVQLESHLLRLSISRLGPRDFEAAEAALEAMAQASDQSPIGSDHAFHDALYSGADRPIHKQTLKSLRSRLAPFYADEMFWLANRGRVAAEHQGLLTAVRAGDDKQANSLLIRHLMRAREALCAKVSSADAAA